MSTRESKDPTAEPSHQRLDPLNSEEDLASQVTRMLLDRNRIIDYSQILPPSIRYSNMDLFGKLGLHYYNLQKGTDLKLLTVLNSNTRITSIYTHFITLEAIDPVDHSSCEFETLVTEALEHKGCRSAITTRCRITPGLKKEDKRGWWDEKAVDDFFKGDMPDWMTEDELTESNKLQYYEVEEDTEWLHLYAEFALYSKRTQLEEMLSLLPVEMRKIIVRTREDVESKNKIKAYNAIFYISFKTRCGRDFNAIIRRTTDKLPGHFSLEVKCLI